MGFTDLLAVEEYGFSSFGHTEKNTEYLFVQLANKKKAFLLRFTYSLSTLDCSRIQQTTILSLRSVSLDLSTRTGSLERNVVYENCGWDMVCYTVYCVKICLFHILNDL